MREFIGLENGSELNSSKISKLPIINIKIKEINLRALIDTGSEISLINESIVNGNKEVFQNKCTKISKIRLLNAKGKKFTECSKIINVEFKVKEIGFEGEFVIVEKLGFDVIIGEDILSRLRAKLDFGERSIKLRGTEVQMCSLNEVNIGENANKSCIDKVNVVKKTRDKITCEIKRELEIDCPSEYQSTVENLLQNYTSLINYESRIAKDYVHRLQVDEDKPFKCKTYPIPFKRRKKVQEEIQNMIDANIIEAAKTNFINPLVIVSKKDDSIRICLDARNLNKITKSQFDAPQTIDTMLYRIGKNTIFSKLDLKNSFWLIPLHVDSRRYTGFSVDGHIYQFKVVPFGLQSASSALVRAMQLILDKYEKFCLHYIDDIIIFSETEKEHRDHLNIILNALDESGLKLNVGKCEFYKTSVKYLGYLINQQGISIGKDRIKEIKEYPAPKNLKMLRGFLGILNYYKKFVPRLSELEVPLIELLRKDTKWEWNSRREVAFNKLKINFHDNLLLHSPDFKLPFILRTDASEQIVAAELVQIVNGVETPICFISRILKPYETRYSTSEVEMLAVVYSLSKLAYILTANHFTIETDHSALCSLMSNRFANNRIYRWSLLIQEFSFTIKHRPGRENITADALTRNKQVGLEKGNNFMIGLNVLSDEQSLYTIKNVIESQEYLEPLKNIVRASVHKGYSMKGNILIKTIMNEEKYVIHDSLALDILNDLHKHFGHIGVRKTWMIFRENFFCKNDLPLTKRIISLCHECCVGKNKNYKNRNKVCSIVAREPFELVAIDFISNLIKDKEGCKHILVIVDIFSKFTKVYPTKKCNTNTVCRLLSKYFKNVGIPTKILADNATYFDNDKFKKFLTDRQVRLSFTTIRHPQANPAERYIQEVIKVLRLYVQRDHTDWVQWLRNVEYVMNGVPSTITQMAPITIMFGSPPIRPWGVEEDVDISKIRSQVRSRLERNAKRYRERENKKIKKHIVYKQGDRVVIKSMRVSNLDRNICAKFRYPYEGPYIVNRVLNDNTYELKQPNNENIRGKFHIEMIYPYTITE